jgi:hypothetical protein
MTQAEKLECILVYVMDLNFNLDADDEIEVNITEADGMCSDMYSKTMTDAINALYEKYVVNS